MFALIAQTYPTSFPTAPSSWRDPAAVPFAVMWTLFFAGGLVVLWRRVTRLSDRQFQLAKDMPPPAVIVRQPPTPEKP